MGVMHEESLERAARQQALFIILGLRPLDQLDAEQQNGLQVP